MARSVQNHCWKLGQQNAICWNYLGLSELRKENSNATSLNGLTPWAINICTVMFYDTECLSGFIWCGILHIKEGYQRNMVPFFSRIWLFKMEAKSFWSFIQFHMYFLESLKNTLLQKRSSLRVIFFEEQGDLWRFCVIPNWSFQWSIWFHLEILRSGTSMLSNFSHFGCNLGILGDTVMIK